MSSWNGNFNVVDNDEIASLRKENMELVSKINIYETEIKELKSHIIKLEKNNDVLENRLFESNSNWRMEE